MKKVSATITINVAAWVENDYHTDELIQYLKCYYQGSVPDGWIHDIEDIEDEQTVSNIIVENEE
tara:strand:- start:64 stop:255 length:192 start_codon:yes stop_codon:yes gene_type:complete